MKQRNDLYSTGWQRVGLTVVFLWFAIGGVAHFLLLETFVSIIPPSLPYPYAAVLISGMFELLGAIGILLPRYRSMAGWGLVLLTLCVTPANAYMWLHPSLFPGIPEALLFWRLPLQLLLMLCIIFSTRMNKVSYHVE